MVERWNIGFQKDISHFKFYLSALGGPLPHPCKIPIPIIPAFQHSNWGEAPNLYKNNPEAPLTVI